MELDYLDNRFPVGQYSLRGILADPGGISGAGAHIFINWKPMDPTVRLPMGRQRSLWNLRFPVGQYSGRRGNCRSGGLIRCRGNLYQSQWIRSYLTKVTAPMEQLRLIGRSVSQSAIFWPSGQTIRSILFPLKNLSIGSQWIRYLPGQLLPMVPPAMNSENLVSQSGNILAVGA